MRKLLLILLLLTPSLLLAGNHITVSGNSLSTSDDENKFLEDEGLKSGVNLDCLYYSTDDLLIKGFFNANNNGEILFKYRPNEKFRFVIDVKQTRKWWDTSAGSELTPGGYAIADYYPNTNTIAPLSNMENIYTTRKNLDVHFDYFFKPLQKVTFGVKLYTKDGDMTPYYRGFTFTGNKVFAATAASLVNYDEESKEVYFIGNTSFGNLNLSLNASLTQLDNTYTSTVGTFGTEELLGTTNSADKFETDILYVALNGNYKLKKGNIQVGAYYQNVDSDAVNSLVESGTYFNGLRNGAGKIELETTGFNAGGSYRFTKHILWQVAVSSYSKEKTGDYLETRTDYAGVFDSSALKETDKTKFDTKLHFLFSKNFKLTLFSKYAKKDIDDSFTSDITESSFDKNLVQDMEYKYTDFEGGLRLKYKVPSQFLLNFMIAPYSREVETVYKDLTWGYVPGDGDTTGLKSNYRLSFYNKKSPVHVSFSGYYQDWDRDLTLPIYDPIYDPYRELQETSTDGKTMENDVTFATYFGSVKLYAKLGYINEEFNIADYFVEDNYQPVIYEMKGKVYGIGFMYGKKSWSISFDGEFIDTTESIDNDRVRLYLDYSGRINDNLTFLAQYKYFKYDEGLYNFDDYQGNYFGLGIKYNF